MADFDDQTPNVDSVNAQASNLAATPTPTEDPSNDAASTDLMNQYLAKAQVGGEAPESIPTGDPVDVMNNYLKDAEAKQRDEADPNSAYKAFGEGAAESATFGVSALGERALGVNPEDIRAREQAHPYIHTAGEIAGIAGSLLTGQGEAAIAAKAASKLVPWAADSLISRVGVGAAKAAIENAMFAGGDEVTKMITEDPTQSAQTAMGHVGLGAILGGGLGGLGVAAGHLWNVKFAPKMSQAMADLGDTLNMTVEHQDIPSAATKELTDLHGRIKDYADDVFGVNKAQAIGKLAPEMNDSIAGQAAEHYSNVMEQGQKLLDRGDSRGHNFVSVAEEYGRSLESADSGSIFQATDKLKRDLQHYSIYDTKVVDPAVMPFVNASKKLASGVREGLEDSSVWGDAAGVQKSINGAYSKFKPTLDDFQKGFTSKVLNEPVVDPSKVATFINKVGKDTASLKQNVIKNFLDKSSQYEDVLHGIYTNAGIESPVTKTPLNVTNYLLKERTTGGKLADAVIKQGLSDGGSRTIGAAIGAAAGHFIGFPPEVGALIGQSALGPFIKRTLPLLIKPAIKMVGQASGAGARAANDFVGAVSSGDSILTRAAKSIFNGASMPINSNASVVALNKLDKQLQDIQEDPKKLAGVGGSLGHYMPDHGTAIASTAANAANYLNSLRPQTTPTSPLDLPRQPSTQEKSAYKSALTIAQNPTSVLYNIQNGSITPSQITTLKVLYPGTYNSMVTKLNTELAEAVKNKTPIPYKVRQGISMFTGSPVDSSMLPMNIQAAQAVQTGRQPASQGPQSPPPKKSQSGSKALKDFGKSYQTSSQAAEEDQGKR